MRRFVIVLALLIGLSACGNTPTGSIGKPGTDVLEPDANAELSYAQCYEKDGKWKVMGELKNPSDKSVTYTVLIYIGQPGVEAPVTSLTVPDVAAGKTAEFELPGIKASGGQCWVRVLKPAV